jgi:hypothetical protein
MSLLTFQDARRPTAPPPVVLGSHGRAGLGGLVAGSVASAVVSHSRRPVLIVHDHGGAKRFAPQTDTYSA